MKKVLITLMLSAFTLGTFVATAHPMLQDTSKRSKRDTMKKDTLHKKPKPIKK
jgi:hypothetical protein